ncbi:MAG: helix-turn-helix transcriptional regulator [Ruminococcaceae bacterium]|nr:helix-turn-helix transcriptional regulator [Oscillospiraceae bacterium]
MYRLLVVNQIGNHVVEDMVATYIPFLFSSVDVQIADSYCSAVEKLHNSCYDLVFVEASDSCDALHNQEARKQLMAAVHQIPDSKVILITDVYSPELALEHQNSLLPDLPQISLFYDVVTTAFPEIATCTHHYVNRRWLLNQDPPSIRILNVLDIIRNEYRRDISLTYLAERVYVSPCYLSTTFSKFMGAGPMAYVNRLRLEQAASMLISTPISVTEICTYLGYNNLPYFCTCFKRKYGMTPAQYRLEHSSVS